MTDPRSIRIADFTYELPADRIARYPLARRDNSKLLLYRAGNITDLHFTDLPELIPPGALLAFNDTKVVAARLLFRKASGGTIEIFCLEPGEALSEISTAMSSRGSVTWQCLVGGASKWKPGQVLQLQNHGITLSASYLGKGAGSFLIRFEWQPADLSFAEMLHQLGSVPLPPYLHRSAEAADEKNYQTVFAREEGSVAAPTAGLHFTPELMDALKKKNVETAFLTLHVGAGTFKPVKTETIGEHEMHSEWINLDISTLEKIRDYLPRGIVAVGTTSLRTLESLYWISCDIGAGREPGPVDQWRPYNYSDSEISSAEALDAIISWMKKRGENRLVTRTGIIIVPGYRFRIVNALVTNFHQPQSTLLLLVAAFIGADWKKLYDHALRSDYRFLSYGDGSLLFRVEF